MAEEAPTPVTNPAPAAAPSVAPVEAAPTPIVAQAPVPAPVAETPLAASVEAPAAVETVSEAPKAPETVIAEALDAKAPETPQPTEVKPEGETKPVTEETKAQEGQSEETAPPPTYDEFKAPEGMTLDNEVVTKFTEILSELELKGKADHTAVQEFGQKAVDFHVQEVKKAVENLTKSYQDIWEQQKTEWKETFLKDPEIGGNRFQTTVDSARNFIRTHGGTPEQQTEFRNLMETSGLGNHPAMIRLLANAGLAMKEGVPLAATTPVAPPKSKTATLYGGKSS